MNNSKILVVGGAGFVGSNLCHHLLSEHSPREIWVVDNLLSSDIRNVPDDERLVFKYGSITDDAVLNLLPKDLEVVFHLSCYHGNQSSIANPIADHDNNTFTTLKLFEHLKDYKELKSVVYAAAGCAVAEKTYGKAGPTPEDAPVSLYHDSPYSISKLIGEMYGNYYWKQYGLPFIKARFQNVYGPREILGAGSWRGTAHTIWRNVIPTFIWKAMQGESLTLYNGGDASRDFIFVGDIVRGLVSCAEKGQPGEAYNLASGVETTISELAEMINDLTGNIAPLDLKPARSWDQSGRRFGSTKKSTEELGFTAGVSLAKGLKTTVEWTEKNSEMIMASIATHDKMIKWSN